jgi:hypothetical protein
MMDFAGKRKHRGRRGRSWASLGKLTGTFWLDQRSDEMDENDYVQEKADGYLTSAMMLLEMAGDGELVDRLKVDVNKFIWAAHSLIQAAWICRKNGDDRSATPTEEAMNLLAKISSDSAIEDAQQQSRFRPN